MGAPTKIFCNGKFKPSIANEGDAGIDLRYNGENQIVIHSDTVYKIPTGLFVEIPKGKCGIVFERSGLGLKYGINILGRVIDSGYRGEICVLLDACSKFKNNAGSKYSDVMSALVINPGDKIAQMVIMDCFPEFEFVNSMEELSNSERGEKGFGSSDAKKSQ